MKNQWSRAGMIGVVLSILACGGPADRERIPQTAERSDYRTPVKVNATSQERFNPRGMPTAAPAATAPRNDSPFHFTVPAGWASIAPTQFRNPNFRIGASGTSECYVTTLSGDGGGLLSNVNRWYAQLQLPPLTEDGLDTLPMVTILGHPARIVNITGTYTGMGNGDTPAENMRLIGALIQAPDQLITVKMTGPEAEVLVELTNFATFIDSLHSGEGHDHGEPTTHSADDGHNHPTAPPIEDGAPLPPNHPPIDEVQSELPPNHPTLNTDDTAAPLTPPTSGGGYAWAVPEGWEASATGSSMRLITLLMTDPNTQESAECYIVILSGTGGGRLANYNRWLEQLGNDTIDQAKLEQLPTLTVLEQTVPVLSSEGAYGGMNGTPKADYKLLGLSVEHNSQSLFIKLVGPKTVVEAHAKNFEAFCTSLKVMP